MKRIIKITELLQRMFTVEANNEDEALDIVNREYFKGNIVLTADDYDSTEIEDITDSCPASSIELLPNMENISKDWRDGVELIHKSNNQIKEVIE